MKHSVHTRHAGYLLAAAVTMAVVPPAATASASASAAAPTASASASATHDGVMAVTPRSGGGADITSYTPARGITDAQLYAMLKSHGVKGLVDPAGTGADPLARLAASGDVAPAAAACTIGTAHTNGCPGIHWANNGYSHPQVYFVDHTSSAWPITDSTATWNQAQGVDSIYVYGSCPGYKGTHCANMYDANYGATGWAGLTYTPVDSNRNILDGKVTSKFNDYYGAHYSAAEHRQDTCHEQGHVLGLAHNDSTNSCIYYAIIGSAPQKPDADDFALLKSVYSYKH